MIFNSYAKYYDLLYETKDYKREVDYIDSLIKRNYKKENIKILDIGCGTGTHARYLVDNGYDVTGIDFSEEMIRIAKEKEMPGAEFYVGNAINFELNQKFDVILSLFHVVSYQTTNQQISDLFANVSKHLTSDGIFIFDFWYGPAVLEEKPSVRIKRLEDTQIKVFRLAEPEVYINENIVDVNYELIIYNKTNKQTELLKESHRMRYLFIQELDVYLKSSNMNSAHYEEWITGNKPSASSWGVCCIAKKES